MPLPANNEYAVWPPESWQSIYDTYLLHDAWYSGDMQRLSDVYSLTLYNSWFPRSAFWARETGKERRCMVHVPVASDMAMLSADLLFAEPPTVSIPEASDNDSAAIKAEERLLAIVSDTGVINRLHEAAETCAAMGGVFLKVNWDSRLSGFPLLSVAQADAALPEWSNGILTACTFHRIVLEDDNRNVYRHLERHEPGLILNGLYKGTATTLGKMVALNTLSETATMPPAIQTGIDGLLCLYVANAKPNRVDRSSNLGRSDFAGSESLMDSLDEVYTSWLRDIRLGQGRIIAPENFFERVDAVDYVTNASGQLLQQTQTSFRFDLDREAYMALNVPVSSGDLNSQLTIAQFAIRTEEHKATALELFERIITTAGYAPQSFGLNIDGSAESGTALNIRERRSQLTRGRKERYWRPSVETILYLMLQVDALHLSSGITPYRPAVVLGDSYSQTLDEIANSLQLLSAAESASIETRVRMLHGDWGDEQVAEEVERIRTESGSAVPDAIQVGLP